MVWEYWFILLGITEYIIYRSFIKSLKYTGEYDTDNSTQAGIRHNIRWLIAIDKKHNNNGSDKCEPVQTYII